MFFLFMFSPSHDHGIQIKAGQLVDFKWRLGVAISSSSCKNLASPYVAMSFTVQNANGNKIHHTVELSYKEFQVSEY